MEEEEAEGGAGAARPSSPLTSITQFTTDSSGEGIVSSVRVRAELGDAVRKFEMPRTATLAALRGECARLFGRECTPCAMNAEGEFAEITSDVRARQGREGGRFRGEGGRGRLTAAP